MCSALHRSSTGPPPIPGRGISRALWWIGRICLAFFVSAGFFSSFPAGVPTEDEVKAAFLYNFTKFIEWPDKAFSSPRDPLVVCVWDNQILQELADRTFQGRTTGIRHFLVRGDNESRNPEGCHLLFLGSKDPDRLNQDLAAVHGRPILTVGDAPGFCAAGGMIGLYQEGRRLRFEIKVSVGEAEGLKFNSNLLQLARLVN